MTAAIECTGLSKVYTRGIVALCDVSFAIPKGASFGLLGANGAGKSTLVRLIMGFSIPAAAACACWARVAYRECILVFLFRLALTLYSFTQGNAFPELRLPLMPLSDSRSKHL